MLTNSTLHLRKILNIFFPFFGKERNKDSEDDFADLTLVFDNADGTTDKVSSVEFIRNAESNIFYNPYGQRVKADTKGIVISNGKKVFNR